MCHFKRTAVSDSSFPVCNLLSDIWIEWLPYYVKLVENYSNFSYAARILRGLRIAARLGLSFSKDTESAMHDLSASIEGLDKVH